MEQKTMKVFSETSNYGVVRMPGRSFPGVVVQGDSLAILCRLARSVKQRVALAKDSELVDDASELIELLEDRLRHYEEVLAEHGIKLPYTKLG